MASFFSNLFGARAGNDYQVADIYKDMRNQIFGLPGTDIAVGDDDRLAITMETGLKDACYTLVAVADGSASLYFSNGGGIIGAGQHSKGAEAAKSFLKLSEKHEDRLQKVDTHPLPRPGMTRFYVIKKSEILSGEFKEDDLGNNKSPLSPLFHKGHELITIIRMIDEQR